MKAYALYLMSALLFYVGGVIAISLSSGGIGCVCVALGCAFFAVALSRRRKVRKDQDQ